MQELEKSYPNQEDKFWIWASDENGKPIPAEAHSVRITKKVKKLYKITLDNDFVIEATDNHPFRLINGDYVRADELKTEVILLSLHDNINHKIKSIEVIDAEETPVYDLTVDDYHNFAIKAGDDSSIFVHNSHIQTLLMTFFFRFLQPIIQKGYLYLAQPPLYRYKKGKNEIYLKDDKALNDFIIENGIDIIDSHTISGNDDFNLTGYDNNTTYDRILNNYSSDANNTTGFFTYDSNSSDSNHTVTIEYFINANDEGNASSGNFTFEINATI